MDQVLDGPNWTDLILVQALDPRVLFGSVSVLFWFELDHQKPLQPTKRPPDWTNGSIFRATIEQHEPDMYITFIWFIWGGHNPLYGAADPMGVNNLQIKCLFSLLY